MYTGDDGMTYLYNGERVSKHHPIVSAMGVIDELSAHIGKVLSNISIGNECHEILENIQRRLNAINSYISTLVGNRQDSSKGKAFIDAEGILGDMERKQTVMIQKLPKLTTFILPGGGCQAGAELHISSTVCQRAERKVSKIIPQIYGDKTESEKFIQAYLNRLSGYLFVMARFIDVNCGFHERIHATAQ